MLLLANIRGARRGVMEREWYSLTRQHSMISRANGLTISKKGKDT